MTSRIPLLMKYMAWSEMSLKFFIMEGRDTSKIKGVTFKMAPGVKGRTFWFISSSLCTCFLKLMCCIGKSLLPILAKLLLPCYPMGWCGKPQQYSEIKVLNSKAYESCQAVPHFPIGPTHNFL